MNASVLAGLITLVLVAGSSAAELSIPKNPERPGLFLNAQEISVARERIEKEPWARAAWEKLRAEADTSLARPVKVPEKGAGHFQQYNCPTCGFNLLFDEDKPAEHPCPSCGEVYSGEPYDSAWRVVVQHQLGVSTLDLALAYAISGDRRYADKAAEILRAYADVYPTYPVQRVGGRAFLQSLTECQWTINLAWAYDLIAGSGALSTEDRAHIEKDLLKASGDQIMGCKSGGNWQTWHNSAMAAVGWCIGDETLARTSIEDPKRGALRQIESTFYPDGFQVEGSFGYHYYSLRALRWTLEAAWHKGLNLYENPRVKQMFLGPPKVVMPNGEFPSVNDGANPPLYYRSPLYEIAVARIGDPALGTLLRAIYGSIGRHDPNSETVHGGATLFEQGITGRDSVEALLFGGPLPERGKFETSPAVLPDIGFAALRAGGNWAFIDYGPHGGGHGHQDKLNVSFFALGRTIAPDVGAVGYGMPSYGTWNKHTAAHNTVVINGASQNPAAGSIRDFTASPVVQLADTSCDAAYPDTHLRRVLWLTSEYMVDFFRVRSDFGDRNHLLQQQVDWLWHSWGTPRTELPLSPRTEPAGTGNGYQHFTNQRSAATDGAWSIDWLRDEGNVRMTMLGCPGTEIILADGIGTIPAQKLPAAIVRRHTGDTVFRSVIEPSAEESRIARIEDLSCGKGCGVRIRMMDGSVRVHVLADGLAKFGEVVLDRGVASASFDASGRLEWLQFSGGRQMIAGDARISMESEGSVWLCRSSGRWRLGMVAGTGKLRVRAPGSPAEVELPVQPGAETTSP